MAKLYIGVMSGTSLDGIDIVLCKINDSKCELLFSHEYSFDKELKKEILHLIDSKIHLKQVGIVDNKLGKLYAKSINKFIKTYKINASTVDAIGLHGQTLWHNPEGEYPFSMQLGCPNIVSAKTGIRVVTDFRGMDVANGGQGAPFTPAFHQFLFASEDKKSAVLNIGGMANITLLGEKLQGWDCGPGNVLMDLWISKIKKIPFDKGGKFAGKGRVNKDLLNTILSDNYYHKLPPKSTGREKFNKKYLLNNLSEFKDLKPEDVQRTLLELTAKTIVKDVKSNDVQKLIVCGGGVKNRILMKRIKKLTKIEVVSADTYSISSDFLEAMAFAWLAYMRINAKNVDLCSVTGAKKTSQLGGIYG